MYFFSFFVLFSQLRFLLFSCSFNTKYSQPWNRAARTTYTRSGKGRLRRLLKICFTQHRSTQVLQASHDTVKRGGANEDVQKLTNAQLVTRRLRQDCNRCRSSLICSPSRNPLLHTHGKHRFNRHWRKPATKAFCLAHSAPRAGLPGLLSKEKQFLRRYWISTD